MVRVSWSDKRWNTTGTSSEPCFIDHHGIAVSFTDKGAVVMENRHFVFVELNRLLFEGWEG